jgi:hypothetical protein
MWWAADLEIFEANIQKYKKPVSDPKSSIFKFALGSWKLTPYLQLLLN